MTTAFQSAIGNALDTIRGVAGAQVIYRRDAAWVTIKNAVRGASRYETDSGDGLKLETVSEDFLIGASSLTLNGSTVEPKAGDTIEQELGGKRLTFEVMSPGGDEPAWRYSDAGRTQLRVHTKLMKEEEA